MKKLISFLIVFIYCSVIHSQIREYGIFAGGAYYIGDLNSVHYSQQQSALGLVYKYNSPNKRTSFRLHLMHNQIKANDFITGIPDKIRRNLSFKNNIIEIGSVFEVNFFDFQPGQNNPEKGSFGTPYFFGGLGLIRSNPKANLDGDWVELQPLTTEGVKYSRNQIVIPFGFGVKVNFTHHISLSFEYGIRKTFTDYLDDVSGTYPDLDLLYSDVGVTAFRLSNRVKENDIVEGSFSPSNKIIDYSGMQRGNSANKDWYMVSGIVLTYELFSDSSCPKW
tara:strand:- start:574 stop:1407 length:834 start_codon:yes stop_codon:yes gene_type:complete